MNDAPLLLGLDLGSTNIKAVIYERDGTAVGLGSVPCETHYPQAGWAHYEPEHLWQQCLDVVRAAVSQIARPERIVALSVTSFGEAGALIDAHGQPTTNIIGWFDQRSRAQYERMVSQIDPDRLFQISGTQVQQIMSACKIMWHREHEPEAFARSVMFLNAADYIAFRLCGVAAQSRSLGSRTGLMDLRAGDWSDELLEICGIPRTFLRPIVDGGEPLGPVLPEIQSQTGLPAGTIVAVGGHDHPCGALAAGAVHHGDFLDSMGTTECLFVAIDHPIDDPAMGHMGYTLGAHARGSFYTYGGLYTAGICYEWFRTLAASDVPHAELLAAAAAVPAGSLGVTFIPHLRLSNTPYPDSRVRGAFVGLTTDVERATMLRAVLEGVAYEARAATEPLFRFAGLPQPTDCTVIGGTARNQLLLEIKGTIARTRMHVLQVEEASALGAAMLSGIATGVYDSVHDAVHAVRRTADVLEPDTAMIDLYDQVFAQVY